MNGLWSDLRFVLRLLWRNPAYAVAVILILALGAGANTAAFSIVNSVLLRPLPYGEPERIVMVWTDSREERYGSCSYPDFQDWCSRSTTFEALAATRRVSLTLRTSSEPERVAGAEVSATYFRVLGIRPMLGRDFRDAEDRPGAARVAVISHGLWSRRYGRRSSALGSSIVLNGHSYTIIGVLPPEQAAQRLDVWVPIGPFTESMTDRGMRYYLRATGRLKQGVSLSVAQAEMARIADALGHEHPATNRERGIRLVPLHEQVVENIRPSLLALWAAAALVLMLACGNLAGLALARLYRRTPEIALRSALGAGRLTLIRLLVAESAVLCLAGATTGGLLGAAALRLFLRIAPQIPRGHEVEPTAGTVWAALGSAFLAALVFGLLPARKALQVELLSTLKGGRGWRIRPGSTRFGGVLIAAQVALAFVLTSSAALVLKSLVKLLDVETGFDRRNVLTLQVSLPPERYPDAAASARFYRDALARIESVPGIERAAVVSNLPLTGWYAYERYRLAGAAPADVRQLPAAEFTLVTPQYFETLRIPLRRGRTFTAEEAVEDRAVAIVDERLASAFAGADPLERRIRIGNAATGDARWLRIVGVVAPVRQVSLAGPQRPQVYVPVSMRTQATVGLVVRTVPAPETAASAIRSAVAKVDSEQPVFNVKTMDELWADSITAPRFTAAILGVFAVLAAILAALGTYAVVAQAVAQRSHELAVRLSLGARVGQVLCGVLGYATRFALAGAAAGLVAATMFGHMLATLLFGVAPVDAAVFGLVLAILLAIALGAALAAAARVTSVDPVTVLRN